MEQAGFERLCHEHYERVARAAFLIVADREEALDIAQETFARAYEHWGQVVKMHNQAGWLYKVASNLAISRVRRITRTRHHAEPVAIDAPMPSDPRLAAVLAALSPAQRAVLVLRFYLDMSVDATSVALRKRPGTVRALTSQGIARLRDELGATWQEVTDER